MDMDNNLDVYKWCVRYIKVFWETYYAYLVTPPLFL